LCPARQDGHDTGFEQTEELADLVKWCFEHPDELQAMGSAGLEIARSMTHQEMHRRRWRLLVDMLANPVGS